MKKPVEAFSVRLDREILKAVDAAVARDVKRVETQVGLSIKITRAGMIRFLIKQGLEGMGIRG